MDKAKKDPHIDDDGVGSIRWAGNSRLSSSSSSSTAPQPPPRHSASTPIPAERKTQSSIRIYSEITSESPSSPYDIDHSGRFSMDVNAFEKSLQEKRERQMHQPSPRIEIRLRETSTSSPEPHHHGTPLSKINIHHIERGGGIEANTPIEPTSSSYDEVDFISETPRKIKRVITYEKVLKTKSYRKTSYPPRAEQRQHSASHETIRSPTTVHRTADYLVDKSSSTEHIGSSSTGGRGSADLASPIGGADDSAYHSHIIPRVRLASSGTPTAISISPSSSNSLPYTFQSDENVYARQRTPSRERIYERAGSEPPPHFQDTASVAAATATHRNVQSSLDNPATARIVYDDEVTAHRLHRHRHQHHINNSNSNQQWQFVSPVTGSNENVHRRHFHATTTTSISSDGDGISPDWYNEYQTQTIAIECPRKMDFKRSNSQYDNHIRQIRGRYKHTLHIKYHHCTIDSINHIFYSDQKYSIAKIVI